MAGKHYVRAGFSDKEIAGLLRYARAKDMSEEAVLRQALRIYDLMEQTPGSYDAVMALRPNLGPFGCMGDDDDIPPHNANGDV